MLRPLPLRVDLPRSNGGPERPEHEERSLASLGPMMIMLPRTRLEAEYTESDATHLTRVSLEHENVYLAIARSDPEAARAAMRLHLSNSRARLQQG